MFSVKQINDYVRSLLHRDPILNEIWIRGELSNLKLHSSGHMYFTLKDEQARINCVMFRQDCENLNFIPSDGMQVLTRGKVSLYCKEGQYQLYVYDMERDGIGDLYAAYESLKKKLANEGLFDAQYKKTIPPFPKKVAIITSHTGAAVRDIINIMKRRDKTIDILVVPVLVQGVNASAQIRNALDYVNTREDIDVIIVGRGGGSIEELWAFNEEEVARAIWRSRIPVVSAIGHETDNTIADFVADLRAPTPSAAAELVAPDMLYYSQMLITLTRRLYVSIRRLFDVKTEKLKMLQNSYSLKYPDRLINTYGIELDNLGDRMISSMKEIVEKSKKQLASLSAYLDALSPLEVLSRGYAMVADKSGQVIRSIDQIVQKDNIDIMLHDGVVNCNVVTVEKSKKYKKL